MNLKSVAQTFSSGKIWLSILTAAVISLGVLLTPGMLSLAQNTPICEVRPIAVPVAGHFPSSLFKYPFKAHKYNTTSTTPLVRNGFNQTLTWEPAIMKAFLPNTEYTVTLTLVPDAAWSNAGMPGTIRSFSAAGITPDQIAGLPIVGVKGMYWEYAGTENENLLIHITFNATGDTIVAPDLRLYEDFSQGIHDDKTIGWGYFQMAQQANRQGLGNWRDNMTSVRVREDGGSELVLGFKKDPNATNSSNAYVKYNFITAGGVRTRGRTSAQGGGAYGLDDIIFENAYGYYESSIKFPQANVVWGAFWLFSPATAAPLNILDGGSKYATEIDILESPGWLTKFFNAAYHAYRSSADRNNTNLRRDADRNLVFGSVGDRIASSEEVPIFGGYDETGVDIYDGNFHKIGLEWSPTDYIFTVDGIVIGSWSDLDSHYFDGTPYSDWSVIHQNEGVLENPAYVKLTVEAATWADETWDDNWAANPDNPWRNVASNAGSLGIFPSEGEMVVDYVYVLNGPKPPVIAVKGTSTGDGQAHINFDIRSANGKGYSVYISTTGREGSFSLAAANFDSKGAHVKGLMNGQMYYAYIVYSFGGIVEKSDITVLKPI